MQIGKSKTELPWVAISTSPAGYYEPLGGISLMRWEKAFFFNYVLSYAYYPTLITGALAGFILAVEVSWSSGLLRTSLSSAILEFLTFILPTTALGFLLAVFPAWSIVRRIIIRIQGAPFSTGDSVTILKGNHRGKTTKVYEAWGKERVRLELGGYEKASFTDVYFTTDICKTR